MNYCTKHHLLYEAPFIPDKLVALFCETLSDVFKLWVDAVVLVERQQCSDALKVLLHPVHMVIPACSPVNHESEMSHLRTWVVLDDCEDVMAMVCAEATEVVIIVGFPEPLVGFLPRYGPMVTAVIFHELRLWYCSNHWCELCVYMDDVFIVGNKY